MNNTFIYDFYQNFKITLTFFIKKNMKYRQKSHFLDIKSQLSWKLDFFFGWNFLARGIARTRFQHIKIYKNT